MIFEEGAAGGAVKHFTSPDEVFGYRAVNVQRPLGWRFWLQWLLPLIGILLIGMSEYSKRERVFYDMAVVVDGKPAKVINELPYIDESGGKFYDYTVYYDGVDFANWRVIVDDKVLRITVNDVEVDLSDISEDALKDWKYGFQTSFTEYLKSGPNKITIYSENFFGGASLRIHAEGMGAGGWITKFLAVSGFLALCFPLIARLPSMPLRIMFAGTVLFIAYYNSYTTYLIHTQDVDAHIEYIRYLVDNVIPPPPFGGWEFHQPPLYYYLAVPFMLLGDAVDWINTNEFLQYLANISMVVFVYYGIKALGVTLGAGNRRHILATFLLCVWPSVIIHSARVGNDPTFYAFAAMSFYYALVWWQGGRNSRLLWSAVWASCAIMTKSNGVTLVAAVGVLYLVVLFSRDGAHILQKLKFGIGALVIIFVGVGVSFGDNVYYKFQGDSADTLLGTSINSLNGKLYVGNKPRNYLIFDVQTFVEEPYAHPWNDRGGRQYFWNYLFKTSLFGEFIFKKSYHATIAAVQSSIFLLLLMIMLKGFYKGLGRREYLPYYMLTLFSLLALLSFKVQAPAAPHGDFRFVFPILLAFCVFYVSRVSLDGWPKKTTLVKIPLAVLFGCVSLVYFANPH